MSTEKPRLVSLREVEGKMSPHQGQLERALKLRAEALAFVDDVEELARYIGGQAEESGTGNDWSVVKEIFPGIKVHLAFKGADDEFPANLRALFSGEKLELISAEDLVSFVIPIVSHMLRYVRQANPGKKLPEVCYRV